jgi:type I restriction enzyme, R subunit
MYKHGPMEANIQTKSIAPTIDGDKHGTWDEMTQLREESVFTEGRVIVRGMTVKRGEAKLSIFPCTL